MRNLSKKKIYLCALFTVSVFYASDVWAQVVSVPLDPTENVIMPAASGWRRVASIGVEYVEANGSRVSDTSSNFDLNSSGFAGNVAFNLGNFYLEGSYESTTTSTNPDPSSDSVNLKTSDSRASVVLFGDDFVSIGFGAHTKSKEDFVSFSPDDLRTVQTGMIGSISIAVGKNFKVGGAVERVKESSSHKVDNNWVDTTFGLAVELGSPGGTLVRMEVSSTNSPESEKSAGQGMLVNKHPGIEITRANLDIMFSGLLFAFKNRTKSYSINNSDFSITKNQMGVLWVPPDGLVLGFYFTNQNTEKTSSAPGTEYTETNSSFSIKLGHVF